MKFIPFITFLFLFALSSHADTIVLDDGSLYSGKISASTENEIKILLQKNIAEIPKEKVLSLFFSSSDFVYLQNGQIIECKILRKEGSLITVVTTDGERTINNTDIKTVRYNMGQELKVNSLSITDRHFKNDPRQYIGAGKNFNTIYLGGYYTIHFASLDKWKKQFIFENGNHPLTNGFQLGGEIGFSTNLFTIGAGFDHFFLPKIEVMTESSSLQDKVSASFYYATINYGQSLKSEPNLNIYAGIDFGFLNGKENAYNLNDMDFEASATIFASRYKIGTAYFFRNASIYFNVGYLSGKITHLELLGHDIPNYDLDFSGLSLVSGLRFHLFIQSQ
ncbi:hypothetical protein JW935_14470 [candidate division KSB1 bacterium]|nr:hypothetical protein [candidate division KSB1 bacterium]